MLRIEESTLVGIADAIRTKEGSTEPIPTTEMAERIANLPSGASIPLGGIKFNPAIIPIEIYERGE